MTCPLDMSVPTDTDESTSVQTIQTEDASDNDGNAPEVNCDRESGPLPMGSNEITCTATDGSGNSAECKYTITVEGKLFNFTRQATIFATALCLFNNQILERVRY